MVLFLVFIFWHALIPPFCWMPCYKNWFFTCLALLMSIKPSHISNMNCSFRIIFVKIIIIKANVIRIYINKTHIATKNVTLSESALTMTILSLKNTAFSRSLSMLFEANQSGTNFNSFFTQFLRLIFIKAIF